MNCWRDLHQRSSKRHYKYRCKHCTIFKRFAPKSIPPVLKERVQVVNLFSMELVKVFPGQRIFSELLTKDYQSGKIENKPGVRMCVQTILHCQTCCSSLAVRITIYNIPKGKLSCIYYCFQYHFFISLRPTTSVAPAVSCCWAGAGAENTFPQSQNESKIY